MRALVWLAGIALACSRVCAAAEPDSLDFRSLASRSWEAGDRSFSGHGSTWIAAGGGLALASIVASQLLSRAADRRFQSYLESSDPALLEEHYRSARRMDHWSSAVLVAGEAAASVSLYYAWKGSRSPAPEASTVSQTRLCLLSNAGMPALGFRCSW